MSNRILELINVSKSYIGGYLALSEVSLSLDAHGSLCIIGESNSGKTTLLKIIAGLEPTSGGKLLFNNVPIKDIKNRNVGYYTLAEMPRNKSVFDILAYPLKLRKNENLNYSIEKAAKRFNIENLLRLKIKDLNTMQIILVALARLFIVERDIYLIDNPFELLSLSDRILMASELKNAIKNIQGAVIISTDSITEAESFGFEHNAVLAYSVMTRIDYLWNLRANPPNLAVARILDNTASILHYNKLTKTAFNTNGIMPKLLGDFSEIGILLYANDYTIGNGDLSGIIELVYHMSDKILYHINVDGDILIIADYNFNKIYKIGEQMKFDINIIRPFDLLSEQNILKK